MPTINGLAVYADAACLNAEDYFRKGAPAYIDCPYTSQTAITNARFLCRIYTKAGVLVSTIFDQTYTTPGNTPISVKADIFRGSAPIFSTAAMAEGEYLLTLQVSGTGLYTATETIGFTILQAFPTITGANIGPNPIIHGGSVVVACNVPAGTPRGTITFVNPNTGLIDHVQELIIAGTSATATIDTTELTIGTYNVGDIELQTISADGTTGDIDETLWLTILDPETSGQGIGIYFEDALGVRHDLTQGYAIYFGKMQLGAETKVKCYIRNNDAYRPLYGVLITPIAHPTQQLGPAENTYGACTLSTSESGTYTPTLSLGSVAAGSLTEIWLKWTVASDALPGWGFFALKAEGVYYV